MESTYISMRRMLSPRHPIYELLVENFWFTMIINAYARKRLITPDGPLATARSFGFEGMMTLAKSAGQRIDFSWYNIPQQTLRRRGLSPGEFESAPWEFA